MGSKFHHDITCLACLNVMYTSIALKNGTLKKLKKKKKKKKRKRKKTGFWLLPILDWF